VKLFGIAVVLLAAAVLFGCIGGGGQTTPTPVATPVATPVHTPTPVHTATPVVTPTPATNETPSGTATPAPTGTPVAGASPTPGGTQSWESLTGCDKTGLGYTYRMTSQGTQMDLQYATSDGGTVNGVATVLQTTTMTTGGMNIVTRTWTAKVGCSCVKVETEMMGQVTPGQCAAGAGSGGTATPTITNMGTEQVSVPAYTGSATRYHLVSTSASGSVEMDYWVAPSINVPVKTTASGVTMELVSYTS